MNLQLQAAVVLVEAPSLFLPVSRKCGPIHKLFRTPKGIGKLEVGKAARPEDCPRV